MKKIKWDNEEREILDSFLKEELKSNLKNREELDEVETAAERTLKQFIISKK